MNIQIFGKNKCFDTRKAERYFKERGLKAQYVDVQKYGISAGEFRNVKQAVGGVKAMADQGSKAFVQSGLAYNPYEAAWETALLENPALLKTPIVRCGKRATVGYRPEIWESWRD